MRKLNLFAAIAVLFTLYSVPATAATDGYSGSELSADLITAVVPFGTFWIAHKKDDSHGEGQWVRSTGASLIINSVLRYGLKDSEWSERPNGSPYGFPSGHTAFMASSAAFLQDRYGWKYGVPAYALTGYVAWVRVDTDHHRWRDVIAGAALSWSVSKLFVSPHDMPHITPIIGPKHIGLQWERTF